jgi:cell wall-associated NlpC family hydrolase
VLFQQAIARNRLVALVTLSLVATTISSSAAMAEHGIPPGTPAVISAGQSILVRTSPGWDAAVAYELPDGSPITVWDVAQAAPDGSLWYPVDGGFVPVDAVTSATTLAVGSGPAEAPPLAEDAGGPALADPTGAAPAPPDQPVAPAPPAPTMDSPPPPAPAMDPAVAEAAIQSGDSAAEGGWVDRATGAWVEPTAVESQADSVPSKTGVDPTTGQPVDATSGDAAPVQPAPDVVPDEQGHVREPRAPRSAGVGGAQIASFALEFQGYPYVYAGEGPYAFDCSGFTMFVIHNTLGVDVPHDMTVQFAMGQPVSRDALAPGDLVFFANTLHPGMSHNGIYIGGGQFVHAENEASGVTVSDLDADYYASRWYGAVRFA